MRGGIYYINIAIWIEIGPWIFVADFFRQRFLLIRINSIFGNTCNIERREAPVGIYRNWKVNIKIGISAWNMIRYDEKRVRNFCKSITVKAIGFYQACQECLE